MEEGRHPIFDAAYKGNLDLVQTLTEQDAQRMHTIDRVEWTPLLYAAFGGHVHVLMYLLERGADLRHEDKGGRTGLHIAARGGHEDIVKLLLESGAAVNAADHQGRMGLMDAASYGIDAVALMLLEHRADIDAADMWGHTAMHRACMYEQAGMLKLLLEAGGSPTCRNEGGQMTLSIAKANN